MATNSADLTAAKPGTCSACSLPIAAGDHFCWGTRHGDRVHPWCTPQDPEEPLVDEEALKGEIVEEIASRLQGADAETIADMVALRLARPMEDSPTGPPIGTMRCDMCGSSWAVSNGAIFRCSVCEPTLTRV